MRRVMLCVLVALFALAGYGAGTAIAQEKEEKKAKTAATPGELRWHGTIVRWNKENSTLDVRKGSAVKSIHYDSSTQWTHGTEASKGKTAEMSEFTEGSDVICLGKADEKGLFHATRIDLRAQEKKP